MNMTKAKTLIIIAMAVTALMIFQACGKSGGFGVGGNVIINGAGG